MQETWVRSLVWYDPTCLGVTKPVCHDFWAHTLQLLSLCPRACVPQEKPPQWEALAPQLESNPCSPQLEKSPCSSEDPVQPKINKNYKKGFFTSTAGGVDLTPGWGTEILHATWSDQKYLKTNKILKERNDGIKNNIKKNQLIVFILKISLAEY